MDFHDYLPNSAAGQGGSHPRTRPLAIRSSAAWFIREGARSEPKKILSWALHKHTWNLEGTRMLFGLINTPVELQRQANHDFLGPVNEEGVVLHMGDVLLCKPEWAGALAGIAPCSAGATGEDVVCKNTILLPFHARKQPLRFRISAAGVERDPASTEAIQRWPPPLSRSWTFRRLSVKHRTTAHPLRFPCLF